MYSDADSDVFFTLSLPESSLSFILYCLTVNCFFKVTYGSHNGEIYSVDSRFAATGCDVGGATHKTICVRQA